MPCAKQDIKTGKKELNCFVHAKVNGRALSLWLAGLLTGEGESPPAFWWRPSAGCRSSILYRQPHLPGRIDRASSAGHGTLAGGTGTGPSGSSAGLNQMRWP